MPIPKPGSDETQGDFMNRCMSDSLMVGEYPNNSQRFAVCNSSWESKKMTHVLLLERDAWIKAIGPDDADVPALRKGFGDCVKAINATERTVDNVITTGSKDRDGDIINPKKWQLKNYKKNPVVQWAHDHDVPVIASSAVKVEKDKLISTDTFPEEGIHPFADMIFNLVAGKFIRAKSVGFQPERGKFAWDEEQGGYLFDGQELLEHSYVNVPSNPEALVGAKSAGIDIAPMVEWAQGVLETGGPGLWLPRDVVERALKIAENERAVVPMSGFKLKPASGEDKPAMVLFEIPLERSDIGATEVDAKLMDVPEELYESINAKLSEDDPPTDPPPVEFECEHCGSITQEHECSHKEVTDPADAVTGEQLLAAFLDSSDPKKPTKETFTDDELAFIGQAFGQSVVEHTQEAVRQRLTALTGRLD